MEKKYMAIAAAAIVLACAGLGFSEAAQAWGADGAQWQLRQQWNANWTNSTGMHRHMGEGAEWNWTGNESGFPPRGIPPCFEGNPANSTNGTVACEQHRFGFPGNGTNSTFNSTQVKEFESAVLSGDYATASQLHAQYGLGGPIFDRLNETTFAKFSQIRNLQHELAQALGMGSGSPGMGVDFIPWPAFGHEEHIRGMMRNVAYHQTPTAVPDN